MNHKWKHMIYRLFPLGLAALSALGLAACGKKQEADITAWVYVPEYLDLKSGDNVDWYDTHFVGDDLYYISFDWEDGTESCSLALNRYSVLKGDAKELELSLPEDADVNSWTVGEDGSFYAALVIRDQNETTGIFHGTYMLAKYDSQGKELFVNDFTDLMDSESYLEEMAVDREGRIYVSAKSALWLFDADGRPAGSVNLGSAMGSWLNSLCRGTDGRVYAAVTNFSGNGRSAVLSSINFEKKSLEDGFSDFPFVESLSQNTEGNFVLHDRTSVYLYDVKSQEKEKLFDWMDCDINGNYVTGFGALSDGRIAATFEDWESDDSGLVVINKVSASDTDKKQQIVLGMLYEDSEIEAAVVKFNKNSDTYHVTIRYYIDYDSWSDTSVSDALTRLNNDITSENCPDILSLSGINIQQLAAKGVFEDLNPYLDQSSMDRSDMLENVLDAYTYNGKLICILDSFEIKTIVGSASQVGKEMGWTLDEMIAFADAHPEAELFDWMPKEEMLSYFLTYNMGAFVNWETGNCSFDSDEFKSLLEFAAKFPSAEEMGYGAGLSMPVRIQNKKVLLADVWISELDEIQMYKEMFGGDVTCIGYPNTDGTSGAILSPSGAYAITASSKVKEGAWDFLESYLTRDDDFYSWGFPNSKSRLERMADEKVNVVYILDENGEPLLDEHGNPMVEGEGSNSCSWDDWVYYFRVPTREEVDMVLELIRSARLGSNSNDQIMTLINEEAAAFFQGQKSVDDVAITIQSRVKVYVDENR